MDRVSASGSATTGATAVRLPVEIAFSSCQRYVSAFRRATVTGYNQRSLRTGGVYVTQAALSSAAAACLQLRSPEKEEPTAVPPLASCLVAAIPEAAGGAASACGEQTTLSVAALTLAYNSP